MVLSIAARDRFAPASLGARLGFIAAAGAVVLVLVFCDFVVNNRSLLAKDRVDWTTFGLIRPLTAFLAACLLVMGLQPSSSAARPPYGKQAPLLIGVAWISAAILSMTAAIVIIRPELLNETVREGQFLSILTEVGFVVGLAGFGLAIWRSRHDRGRVLGIPVPAVFAAMFLACLLVLMEEMSWGQHWIGWTAGPMFEGNAQNETNLHNFATYRFEAVYYSAAFLLFVLLPMFWPSDIPVLKSLERFVPPRLFALAGLPLAGFLYEEWNIVIYQVWFFMVLLISMKLAADLWRGPFRAAGLAVAVLLPVSQLVFVFGGHRMVDGYELSEIREFLIAVLIAAYAWWLVRNEAAGGRKSRPVVVS
ncbi:hypothetical protein SAMN04488498_111128 [Mesorhizobium albiziae]|uniref:Uncharacterized protein n=1 Tax=Neomesorhizobium albiziae TaxID=335020 RepID=A0A1I4BXH4_9HYPH|nr:hypothetical protein [Mesorhizobium albiziae]GLS29605.1 hypothetical protein GCM10007937_13130 [Mesorhizobium albiziae]SFK73494.1 hypothetical protein SAMN04488498_111128 [Mesorhizobium albiziae]